MNREDLLLPETIKVGLKTKLIGQMICHYQTVGSTNDTAKELAREGAPHGTLVLAERQTAGKGRLGRTWESVFGLGIWGSLILRPNLPAEGIPPLGLIIALEIAEAIYLETALTPLLRWPNDVLLGGKKVCGILVETESEGLRVRAAVAGFGINANHSSEDFSEDLRMTATSLRLCARRKVSRASLLRVFLSAIEPSYELFLREGLVPFLPRLRDRSAVLGRGVSVETPQGSRRGEAIDLDEQGRLLVRDQNGSTEALSSGQVKILR